MDYASLESHARAIRRNVVRMAHRAKEDHLMGALSCVDILVALYGTGWLRGKPGDPERDRLFLSKGHSCAALYATLAEFGVIDPALLETYSQPGSSLTQYPIRGLTPGSEMSGGSLGHGLGYAAGAAYALKQRGSQARCIAILGDGECNEGSVWESAMFAAAQKLDNLVCVVDANGLQGLGRCSELIGGGHLRLKFKSFGWMDWDVDGHDFEDVIRVMHHMVTHDYARARKPSVLIANTVGGKGVSIMENDELWHYRVPSDSDLAIAEEELTA